MRKPHISLAVWADVGRTWVYRLIFKKCRMTSLLYLPTTKREGAHKCFLNWHWRENDDMDWFLEIHDFFIESHAFIVWTMSKRACEHKSAHSYSWFLHSIIFCCLMYCIQFQTINCFSLHFLPIVQVRAHAVAVLERAEDVELQCYLLQLVQALRFERSDKSPLAHFLVHRGELLYWLFLFTLLANTTSMWSPTFLLLSTELDF